MHDILTNLTSEELLPALESNMTAFWSPYGRADGSHLHMENNLMWFYTGVPFPLFNGVISMRRDVQGLNDTFDGLKRMIVERGSPALWWIGPRSKPDNIESWLLQNGLTQAGEVPGMAIDLATLGHVAHRIANFAIDVADDTESQALWGRVAGIGTGFSASATDALERLEAGINDPQYRAQYRYIGYLDGTPVATSALVLEAGVAGVYAVATLPEARRKGIGSLMTLKPLMKAKEMGYRVAILQSSSAGYPIYKRIGFSEVCTYRLCLQNA